MYIQDGNGDLAPTTSTMAIHDPCSVHRDVTYSCGSCGYALNLSSSNRNTTDFGSKYGKAIKKGIIPFVYIDESRFSKTDEFRCLPYFFSKNSWGLFRRRTKLLCRKCGSYIGNAYDKKSPPVGSDDSDTSFGNGTVVCKKYNIKISALQPSSDESGIPLCV